MDLSSESNNLVRAMQLTTLAALIATRDKRRIGKLIRSEVVLVIALASCVAGL